MTGEVRLLGPEGLFSLDVASGWRWEQTSEDGSFVFHDPEGAGVVRFAETPCSGPLDALLPGGEPCTVNGADARAQEEIRDGRRLRRWVVTDGHTVVHVSHEAPAAAGTAHDDRVDALVGSLRLRREPHPTVARLLHMLDEEPTVRQAWTWNPAQPLVIACAELDQEVSVEGLVRRAEAAPNDADASLRREVGRLRNLAVFTRHLPPFSDVADALLPLVRSTVLQESVDDRMRSVAPDASAKARLVCGADLVRRLFAPGLFVYFGVDVPGAFHFITPAILNAWGVSSTRLEATALENLRRRLTGDRLDALSHDRHRMAVFEDGEGLAASRLLLPRFRDTLTRVVGDRWRVGLPSAGVLIAFSEGFEEWQAFLGEDVWDAYLHEPVPLTPQIYTWEGGETFSPVA